MTMSDTCYRVDLESSGSDTSDACPDNQSKDKAKDTGEGTAKDKGKHSVKARQGSGGQTPQTPQGEAPGGAASSSADSAGRAKGSSLQWPPGILITCMGYRFCHSDPMLPEDVAAAFQGKEGPQEFRAIQWLVG